MSVMLLPMLGARLKGFVAEVGRRFGWGIADQTLSSLTNFALTFLVARSVGAAEFGDFAIAFTVYLTSLGLARAAITSPLSIRYSTCPKPEWQHATRSATGSVLVLGVGMGIVCALAGLFLTGPLREALVALGIFLPALLLQDTWRFAFFAAGRKFQAFANDLVWAFALFALVIPLSFSASDGLGWFVAAWGGASAIAGLFGAYQAGLIPRPQAALSWWRNHRDLTDWFVQEFIAIRGSIQIATFGIAAILGVEAVGALRGGAVLFGPPNIIVMGLGIVAVPEGARSLVTSSAGFRQTMFLISGSVTMIAVAWGGVLMLLPDSVGAQLLGETWYGASELLLPLTVGTALGSAALGFTSGLRALGAAKMAFRARLFVTVFLLAGVFGGALIGQSAQGVVWGDATANGLSLFIWWHFFHEALRGYETQKREVE
jgi:O-antigen/teichoic acid export membrane protein